MNEAKPDKPFSFLAMMAAMAMQMPSSNGSRGSNNPRGGFKARLGHRLLGQLDSRAMKFARDAAEKRRHVYMHRAQRQRELGYERE